LTYAQAFEPRRLLKEEGDAFSRAFIHGKYLNRFTLEEYIAFKIAVSGESHNRIGEGGLPAPFGR